MAIVKIQGSNAPQDLSLNTISAIQSELGLENYTATLNGEPTNANASVGEFDVVHFSESVKGGK